MWGDNFEFTTIKREHQDVLRKALVRLKILEEGSSLPKAFQKLTGMAGISCVYFVAIPKGDSIINLVAKFDEPKRAEREWDILQELQNEFNTPRMAVFPIRDNQLDDKVIIYLDATWDCPSGKIFCLGELLEKQLISNPTNCLNALELTWKTLDEFYRDEPGSTGSARNGLMLKWESIFPDIGHQQKTLREIAKKHWAEIEWNNPYIELPESLSENHQVLPNPLHNIQEKLSQDMGIVMLSRIHGDLNMSNVLVGLETDYSAFCVFIIDLANSQKETPTAMDFSRLESEFWHEVYAKKVKNENKLLRGYISVRDYLEGRTENLPSRSSSLVEHSGRFVCAIRRHANSMLRNGLESYILRDYFNAIYFQQLKAICFKSVKEDQKKARLAILGAALSLQFLKDLEEGRYAIGAKNRLFLRLEDCETISAIKPKIPRVFFMIAILLCLIGIPIIIFFIFIPTLSIPSFPNMIEIDQTTSISMYEISNREYKKFYRSSNYHIPDLHDIEEYNDPLQPVVGVSWNDAMVYCQWLSKKTGKEYSLPTKAQWKKAAGCSAGMLYPSGNKVPDKSFANYGGFYDRPLKTNRANSIPSDYGVYDMEGNVAEWCIDEIDSRRVVCGGAWNDNLVENLKCSSIRTFPSTEKKNFIGFRIIENK